MKVPILNGIFSDSVADLRTSYPVNLVPVPKDSGINSGYLRPADGVVLLSEPGLGACRGGINWNGTCYRVLASRLVSVSATGVVIDLGSVGAGGEASMDYSFDYLAIASGGRLYYWNGGAPQQVTDPDLGTVLDVLFVDGFFMTTDGENLVVAELSDPFSVLPTKYGSAEADPDPVKKLLKVRGEPHAVGRYTIEAFDNIGGTGFPFQRIDGAHVSRGTVGTHTCAVFLDAIAFVGSGRNESIAVWLAANGESVKISTREIDTILAGYTEVQLSFASVETRVDKGHQHLLIHLPDRTLVYDGAASQVVEEPVWFTLSSGADAVGRYLVGHLVRCYDQWLVCHPTTGALGYLTDARSDHWGVAVWWSFGTMIIYNDGDGAIFHEIELVCLTGRTALGVDPAISTEYSLDGETWSVPRFIKAGTQGQRAKRLVWLNQGPVRHWRIQRFSGTSDAFLSPVRLEIRAEALAA